MRPRALGAGHGPVRRDDPPPRVRRASPVDDGGRDTCITPQPCASSVRVQRGERARPCGGSGLGIAAVAHGGGGAVSGRVQWGRGGHRGRGLRGQEVDPDVVVAAHATDLRREQGPGRRAARLGVEGKGALEQLTTIGRGKTDPIIPPSPPQPPPSHPPLAPSAPPFSPPPRPLSPPPPPLDTGCIVGKNVQEEQGQGEDCPWGTLAVDQLCDPPLCDILSGCCFFTGPWTVTRSSLRVLC